MTPPGDSRPLAGTVALVTGGGSTLALACAADSATPPHSSPYSAPPPSAACPQKNHDHAHPDPSPGRISLRRLAPIAPPGKTPGHVRQGPDRGDADPATAVRPQVLGAPAVIMAMNAMLSLRSPSQA
jgi:hypothetical protein